jgi:hypothetical protein
MLQPLAQKCGYHAYLVVLHASEQDREVKGANVVARQHIRVKGLWVQSEEENTRYQWRHWLC